MERDGTPANDWNYRMIIEDRYKRLAVMRRAIRISALVQLVYVCIRTLWHSVPFFTGETPLTASTEYIFYAGVAVFLFRAWAFGFGKANREKLWAIMTYSILSMLLVTECFLVFYMYHMDDKMMGRGAGWQYPQMLAKHYAATLKMSKANVVLIATWFERALDLVGLAAGAINIYVSKEYVMEKKEQKREAAEKNEVKAAKKD
ncbi:hypothetical protein D9Q98_001282 [Chlorella vulgaris]|uniref:Uncharacterized protein n=1 Tax=Chlorella vulgaris TaxID=3077 RepID=A0A9D4Z2H2_CHLVU|nr:hypothetical protein D9Q98_001282 [Chlorella vulgaris]